MICPDCGTFYSAADGGCSPCGEREAEAPKPVKTLDGVTRYECLHGCLHRSMTEAGLHGMEEREPELRFVHRSSCFNAGTDDVFLGDLYLGWIARTDDKTRWFAQPLTENCKVFTDRDEAVELLRKARGVIA